MNAEKENISTAPQRLARLQALASGEITIAVQQSLEASLSSDASDVVRHEAGFILGDLQKGGRLIASESALSGLCLAAEHDPSVLVRHEVALSLAKWPGEVAVTALVKLSSDVSAEVRSSAAYAITEMLSAKA